MLVLGSGGVGSPIGASLAAAGVAEIAVFDTNKASVEGLAQRLRDHYPLLDARTDTKDPAGFDVIVNATPLDMKDSDPLPFNIERISPSTFVGEVVMKSEYMPLLRAALDKGCAVQVGTDMLFEMIPAYLEFFGYGTASADELRAVAKIQYALAHQGSFASHRHDARFVPILVHETSRRRSTSDKEARFCDGALKRREGTWDRLHLVYRMPARAAASNPSRIRHSHWLR